MAADGSEDGGRVAVGEIESLPRTPRLAPAAPASGGSGGRGGGGGAGARDICREVFERLVADGNVEAVGASGPDLLARLLDHFARLPLSYQLDVNAAEQILNHLKVLAESKDANRHPAFAVRFLGLDEVNVDETKSDAREAARIGGALSTRSKSATYIHEILFSTTNKPKLPSQLFALLSDIGLNIREAHVFSTTDGYSLDIFVVDGWKTEDTEGLHMALEASIMKNEVFSSSGQNSKGKDQKTAGDEKVKRIKGNLNFCYAHLDKVPNLLLIISMAGIAAAQGSLIDLNYILLQFLCAGMAVLVTGSVSMFAHAAFFKEIESTNEFGYKVCSFSVLGAILYLLATSCIVLIGFENTNSKMAISLSVGTALLTILTWRVPNEESVTIHTWMMDKLTKLRKRTRTPQDGNSNC